MWLIHAGDMAPVFHIQMATFLVNNYEILLNAMNTIQHID